MCISCKQSKQTNIQTNNNLVELVNNEWPLRQCPNRTPAASSCIRTSDTTEPNICTKPNICKYTIYRIKHFGMLFKTTVFMRCGTWPRCDVYSQQTGIVFFLLVWLLKTAFFYLFGHWINETHVKILLRPNACEQRKNRG